MKLIKRSASLLLCLLMFMMPLLLNAYAQETDMPVVVSVTADKSKYGTTGTARITVTVKNISDSKIENLNISGTFAETSSIGRTNPYVIGQDLAAGEERSFGYQVTMKSDRVSFFQSFILTLKRLFWGSPRTIDKGCIRQTYSDSVTLNFGGAEVTETVCAWVAESAEIYLTPRNKTEAIQNENQRYVNAIKDVNDTHDFRLTLIDIRREALVSQYGGKPVFSYSYYESRASELFDEISELQRQINALQFDTSASGRKRYLECLAEKTELEKEYTKMNNLAVAARMFNELENEKKSIENSRESAIKAENNKHENNLVEIKRSY